MVSGLSLPGQRSPEVPTEFVRRIRHESQETLLADMFTATSTTVLALESTVIDVQLFEFRVGKSFFRLEYTAQHSSLLARIRASSCP